MDILIFFLMILMLGVLGLAVLIGGIVVLYRRRPDYGSVAALEAFDRRVAGWAEQDRLDAAAADRVRALIAADRAKLLGWKAPAAGARRPEAGKSRPVTPAAVIQESAPAASVDIQPVAETPLTVLPASGPRPPDPRPRPDLLSALLALATRRTLLFLGSFLLAVSALTLVIFNWASFPPIIQLGLLAAVAGGLWAGGSWMTGRPDLAAAGRNLQAVGALLVPVVAFALTRPGLLDLAPRAAWLTVSLISLPIYMLAAWRSGRGFYSFCAAIAGVSAGLAAQHHVALAWLPGPLWPPVLAGLALAYLGIGAALEPGRPALARPVMPIVPLLAAAALLAACYEPDVARSTLPPLIALGGLCVALIERGRLAWLAAWRHRVATAGLAMAALLLPAWIWALLDLSARSWGMRGLALAPLAAAAFAGAYWQPGRTRRSYDLTLQAIGALIALYAGAVSLLDERAWVPGALLLAAVWAFQATLRRAHLWAALALGSGLLAGELALQRFAGPRATWWIWLPVIYAAGYALGGSLLRKGPLRHWTWPALGWAALAGMIALGRDLLEIAFAGGASLAQSMAILSLAGTLALLTWIWRRGRLGYPAAALLIAGLMLAAQRGFYTGWSPAAGDLALIACGLAAALGALGQGLRARAERGYALPYEQLGLALLTAAPLLAGVDQERLSLTWLAMAGLYGVANVRHRLPWLLAAGYLALDMGLLHGSAWLLPGGPAEGASLILLTAVAAQALIALWRRRSVSSLLLGAQRLPAAPSYTAAIIGGAGALLLAAGSDAYLAGVSLGLLAVLATVATGEKSAPAAWAAPLLLALGLASLHRALGLALMPGLAWGMAESLALYAAGWAIAGQPGPRWQLWRDPLRVLPAVAGLGAGLSLTGAALPGPSYGELALSLAGISLLLALVARRERAPWLFTAALAGADLAALSAALWRIPTLSGAQLAPIMLVAAAFQVAWAIWLRMHAAGSGWRAAGLPFYTATTISGALALGLAWGDRPALIVAALALALLAGAAAGFERREEAAWLSVGMALLASWLIPGALGTPQDWEAAWVILELLGLTLAGWGLERAGGAHWRRPSSLGPLGLALLIVAGIAAEIPIGRPLPALTFALASLGLLLATLAVRLRQIGYGYAAGAALVLTGMSQLADWGVREIQGYVLPAGVYLLALAAGLRRFQGRRRVSQVIEAGAAMLLLGATFGQALRESGVIYELLLCGEALLITAYGALMRLRVPFLAGVSFFVAGVLWMAVDNVRISNQWVLFGAIGLLMIAAYVLLERYQERLLRAGKAWASELRGWG